MAFSVGGVRMEIARVPGFLVPSSKGGKQRPNAGEYVASR